VIKLIHPKTGTVREVAETNQNKINLLKRAGFVPLKGYRAPKPPKVVAEKTVVDIVKEEAADLEDAEAEGAEPEIAIHVSAAARALIEKNDLDPTLIEGSGKDGQITKPDVKAYLEETASKEQETVEGSIPNEDTPAPAEAPETAPEEPVVRAATEEGEEIEKAMRDGAIKATEEETE